MTSLVINNLINHNNKILWLGIFISNTMVKHLLKEEDKLKRNRQDNNKKEICRNYKDNYFTKVLLKTIISEIQIKDLQELTI